MDMTCQNKKKQFRIKFRLLYILPIILSALIVLSGCTASRRKVVATWPGKQISDKRINEQRTYSQPVLGAVDWDGAPGMLSLHLEQTCTTIFDLEQYYEKIQAVRVLPEHARRAVGEYESPWMILGAAELIWLPGMLIANEKNNEAKMRAIDKLKSGASTVHVDYYGSIPVVLKATEFDYVRETSGKIEKKLLKAQRSEVVIPANKIPVKVVKDEDIGDEEILLSNESGWVSFPIATKMSEVTALKPTKMVSTT